jgi:hypothetical protein
MYSFEYEWAPPQITPPLTPPITHLMTNDTNAFNTHVLQSSHRSHCHVVTLHCHAVALSRCYTVTPKWTFLNKFFTMSIGEILNVTQCTVTLCDNVTLEKIKN